MKNENMGAEDLYLASEETKESDTAVLADTPELALSEMHSIGDAADKPQKSKKLKRIAEIPEKRGNNVKVFRMSDGTEQAVFSPSPIHVFDEETGTFEDVESTLIEDEDGRHFTCGKNHFVAKFSREEDNDDIFSIELGTHKVTVYARKNKKRKTKGAMPQLRRNFREDSRVADVLTFADIEPDTDYEYSVEGGGVKENIIVKKPAASYRYPFALRCDNVTGRFDERTKRIAFVSHESGEEVFFIPAPFMTDANGVTSTAVDYEVETGDAGMMLLTVTADADWMNSPARAFPVAIDPQIKVTGSGNMTTYSWDNGPLFTESPHTVGIRKNDNASYTANRMYIHFNMPTLPRNPRIKKAEIVLYQMNGTIGDGQCHELGLYHVGGNIVDEDQLPAYNPDLIDYVKMKPSKTEDKPVIKYSFDITSLIDQVNKGEISHGDLVLKLINEQNNSSNNYVTLYGSTHDSYPPKIVITYESSYGVNTSYRPHTHELGRFGQGSVDLQCGNLMFESEDFAWSGNRMPVTIKHLFNSALAGYPYTKNDSIGLATANFSAMKLGHGFRLNLMQSVTSACFQHQGSVYYGYVFVDENGGETYFKQSNRQVNCSSHSHCYYLYEDINGGDMFYDYEKHILTQGEDTYLFDEGGRLIRITDAANNRMDITYQSDRITVVTDGAGRKFDFSYNGAGELTAITAPNNTTILYTYTNGLLIGVTYPDGKKVSIEYISNKPANVTLRDASGKQVYKVAYSFDGDRLTSVTEYGANGTFVGAASTYTYSVASARTLVTTTEQMDDEEGETADNVITTTYTFDDDGNIVSEYVYSTDTGHVGGTGEASGINPHSGDGGAGVVSNINNLLTDHNFESLEAWSEMSGNCDDFSVNNLLRVSHAKFGRRILRMKSGHTACRGNGVYQTTNELPAGQYTFSAYLRVISAFNEDGGGAFIRVIGASGNVLGVSERLVDSDSEYTRLVVSFELGEEQTVQVQIVVDGIGEVYVDAAQLENNPYANAYNMLENGNFERGTEGWVHTDGVSSSAVAEKNNPTRFNMSNCLYITGDISSDRNAYQDVAVCAPRSTRETFTLSGWAKAYGLPNHERDGCNAPRFRLRATIKYQDASYKEYSTEEFTADFSPCTEEWQFASVQFSKSKYRTVEYVRVYCDYGYNSGIAYFDDIQLVRNSLETCLSDSDFEAGSTGGSNDVDEVPVDTTDTSEDEIVESADSTPVFNEAKDEYGNALTETTFTDGEFGTIYRAFRFNADNNMQGDDAGNNLIEEIDARGKTTQYTVDPTTSRNTEVIDRCGNKTAYVYDASGRTTNVTSKDASNNTLAHVSYAYDTFDNMTLIHRGDGMKYVLAYNEFHNLESIGIDGKTEKLIQYTYKNGNGRLKEIKYANGDTMKATYNSIGQMIAETWIDTNGVETARYKYVYDGQGNIVRSIDIRAQKEYNYEYEEGRIVRATESGITLSGDIVTAKVVVNTTKYCYDTDGNLIKKSVIPTSGSMHTIYYDTSDDDIVVKFSAGGRMVTSHSGTDTFGRKVFDELQLGTDCVSRQFVYLPGEVTDTHKNNEKVKSCATTQLVSQIILSNGTTLSYSYDAEGRITAVVETSTEDSTPVTNTTVYTYDALGQLLTESVNGQLVNSMEYNKYGNIVKRNGKAYTYGDATWKDLLTGVGNKTIEYDAQGNPVKYLGHTLTWEKDRQLSTFDNINYEYNANGVRTKKIANGIVHEYALDGITILKELRGTNTIISLYDNDETVCGITYNGTPFYFIKNLQEDVIAVTDEFANVVAKYSYDAWGMCSIDQDLTDIGIATINPYRYRSYYFDVETNLYYLQSRYYDPATGRFLNPDSTEYLNFSGTVLSNNLTCYCDNDPINATDYFGHSWFKDKIVKKVKEVAQKAVKAVKQTVKKVVNTAKDTSKKVVNATKETAKKVSTAVKKVAETALGAIAKKATTTLVEGVVGITSVVVSDSEKKTRIKNAAGHIINTINNETARDFWNIYVIEIGGAVLKELKPIATFTLDSAKAAIEKCWTNKSFSGLTDDWNAYKDKVTDMLLEMTGSVSKVLDIYKKMKVEPLSLNISNSNLKNNNMHVLSKNWYRSAKMPTSCASCLVNSTENNSKYITDQRTSVENLKYGEEYINFKGNGCGLIASYNVGVRFARNVDMPAIIYWYEQNSGLVLGGEFGINPYKIPEFLDTISLRCTPYENIEDLENSKDISDGVYIVCDWNSESDISKGAHYYMVENTGSELVAYNNSVAKGTNFADLIGHDALILAYRIFE